MENSTMNMKICLQFYWCYETAENFQHIHRAIGKFLKKKRENFPSTKIFTRVWVENGKIVKFPLKWYEKWLLQWKAWPTSWLVTNTLKNSLSTPTQIYYYPIKIISYLNIYLCCLSCNVCLEYHRMLKTLTNTLS